MVKTNWTTIVEYICITLVLLFGMHCCTKCQTAESAANSVCCEEVSGEQSIP